MSKILPHTSTQDAAAMAPVDPRCPDTKTMWRRLASPLYIFKAGPWLALFHLVLLAVVAGIGSTLIASLIGIVLFPLIALAYGYCERWRLGQLGYRVANGHVEISRDDLWEWIKFRYQEVATWREVGAGLVAIILGSIASLLLALEVTIIGVAIGMMIALATGYSSVTDWALYANRGGDLDVVFANHAQPGSHLIWQMPDLNTSNWWIFLIALLLALPIFAYLNGILTAASASLSNLILSPRPEEYEKQATRLAASRTTILDSFESERRRIERDLHDGVQQELVNINLRLGLAEMETKRISGEGTDTVALQEHLSGARIQLAHALETLRNTVRGIYPAVLETHGLGAALEELSRNTVLPVRVNYLVNEPLRLEIERTAYYVASEAVTNALKHSGARQVELLASTARGILILEIKDDGRGGASLTGGSGLAGLTERVAALGGQLRIDSPAGGPTVLRMELPL